jgi:hypothetical protein
LLDYDAAALARAVDKPAVAGSQKGTPMMPRIDPATERGSAWDNDRAWQFYVEEKERRRRS